MIAPKIHTIAVPSGTVYYSLFDSVHAFHEFVDLQLEKLTPAHAKIRAAIHKRAENRIRNHSDWFGTPPPKTIDELVAHQQFLGMQYLQEVQSKINTALEGYLRMLEDQIIEKPTVVYNDKGLGVFSFDRAATGLFRMQPTAITPPIQKHISQMKIELDRENKCTLTKKVYGHRSNHAASHPSLQVYIVAGANAKTKGDELVYVGLGCAALVEFMEVRGIPVQVNVILETFYDTSYRVGIITVKPFHHPLDKNQLLLISCDPRYFRYRGFQGIIALSNYFKTPIDQALGTQVKDIGKEIVQVLNPKGFVFENSYSLDAAVQEVAQIIKTYATKLKQ
ncbi:hypothetical protein [Aquimarina pacifica]|uniref:hypothetical protein n=1 Tax=Aquimarina pacifica TaxID=1296415 RepID=UPI000471D2F1|nr:hypothetical protein [Aquimarina pacifica]